MPKGCFLVYPNEEDNKDIVFSPKGDLEGDIPEEQQELMHAVERTNMILKLIYSDDELTFRRYYNQLLSLARAGLADSNAQPLISKQALINLQNEVLAREGGKVKNIYMKQLGRWSLTFACIAFLVGFIFHNYSILKEYAMYFFMWAGCMGGTWLSFGVRKIDLSFYELHIPESDRMSPVIRLIFMGLTTMLFGLLLSSEIITVSIGEFSSANLSDSVQLSLLFGMLAGLLEKALTINLYKRAFTILNVE